MQKDDGMHETNPKIDRAEVAAYKVPTDFPEADGTLSWSSTTIVIVRLHAGGTWGLGYTYNHAACATLVRDKLADVVVGRPAMDVAAIYRALVGAVRNIGLPGIAAAAVSALDVAAWDLKARLLDLPLAGLLGRVREAVPAYGSGGFTSYPPERLEAQLAGWVERGLGMVKMKVGSDPSADPRRVRLAREAIGPHADLFVDANGAYARKQALAMAETFAAAGVSWFEEPVTSEDLSGLRLIRDRLPPAMELSAGEYGHDDVYFRWMLDAGAVDVLQAEATRCGGISGFLAVGALCEAFKIPLSSHTAPALHTPICCALPAVRHAEYFHDHVRIEGMLFDTPPRLIDGSLVPHLDRPGLGLELRQADAERFAI
jgi:L-alanine-DL-glutamate epimerase-like enolase superfamily enzyme